MAESILHFGIGLALGTAVMLPGILKARTRGQRLSPAIGRMILFSYFLAFWAIIPNLLRTAGVPGEACSEWPMNIFLLHPLIDRLHPGGLLIGEVLLVGCFCFQYVVSVAAVTITGGKNKKPHL